MNLIISPNVKILAGTLLLFWAGSIFGSAPKQEVKTTVEKNRLSASDGPVSM